MTEVVRKTSHRARCTVCDWSDDGREALRHSHQHARDSQHKTVYISVKRVDYDFRHTVPEDWEGHPTKDDRPPLKKDGE